MINVRKTALELLLSYEREERYVNLLLSSHTLDGATREEKALVTSLLYTAVENKMRYDYAISAFAGRPVSDIDGYVLGVLRLGICQIADMSSVPDFAAVSESVKLARHDGERKFINAVLRRVAREKDDLPLPDRKKNEERYLSVRYSVPKATVKLLRERLGIDRVEDILRAFALHNETSLTVNTRKISRAELLNKLCNAGVASDAAPYSENGIILKSPSPVAQLPGYDEGEFFVQDEASRIMAAALGVSEGDTVIDVCSAPGGKALAAAIAAGEGGKVYAYDLHSSKLTLIEQSAERLGLKNVTVAQRDACEPISDLFGKADRVICDVPCSGLGVIGKKPDLRYKDFKASAEELAPLQAKIIEASAKYVRPGGVMVYSTCTPTKDECEDITDAFVASHPEFSYEDFECGTIASEGGRLLLMPDTHGTDGFYIAKLKRKL